MHGHGTLNRIYRLVWSAVHQCWVVASEVARGRGKKATSSVVAAAFGLGGALLASGLVASGASGASAAPTGGQVVAGSATISQSGTAGSITTTIKQTTDKTSINWQSFNVGSAETVNFVQPSATALAVNRILDTQGSQILGRINANGQVWLINPNGVLFGQGAQINVAGLVATTLDSSDSTLGQASQRFNGNSRAEVSNFGHISAAQGGYVALLGHSVNNQGSITAPGGTVALGGGSTVTLGFADSKLLGLRVEQNLLNALAANGGLIRADGGQVILSAGARDSVLASVVNNSGVIIAQTVQEQEGRIVLLAGMEAGTAHIAGTLDASAPNGGDGGFIETSGHLVQVADGTKVSTLAPQGKTGTWLIDPTDFTISAGSAGLSASGIGATTLQSNLADNNVTLSTESEGTEAGDIHVNAAVSWSANKLILSAHNNINVNAALTGSGSAMLQFDYGQGSTDGGNSNYKINAPVSLPAGQNFTTKKGSDGTAVNWTVITSLGSAGSTTTTDLQGINGGLSGNYVLGADIDGSGTASWNNKAGFAPIGSYNKKFTGKFDGLGHSITGLTIKRPRVDYVGLFGFTGPGAIIQNVALSGGAVTGLRHVGGLVGWNEIGTITNVSTSGKVAGDESVGGLVGHTYQGSISSSSASGPVNGTGWFTGGLVGSNNKGSISSSYASGAVSGDTYVGGLVGYNKEGSISSSYAGGAVGGVTYVGGLMGVNHNGSISNSYASGAVGGVNYVGGLVGTSGAGRISNSYASGAVSANGYFFVLLDGTKQYYPSYAGGLVGFNDAGSIDNSYFDTQTTKQNNGVGAGSSTGVTGLTTAQMQQADNFSGFDFTDTGAWFQYDGYTAPLLRSFLTPLAVTYTVSGTKTYEGTTACGTISCSYTTGALTDGKNLLGSASITLSSKNAGGVTAVVGAGLYSDQQGYLITASTADTATITKASLTVTAGNASKVYGDANPTLTTTVSGFVNGETLGTSGVTGEGAASTVASHTTGVGTAVITAAAGSLAADNYDFTTFTPGALTITARPVTVTADDKTRTYLYDNPALTYTVAADGDGTSRGLVNGDSLSGSLSTAATQTSAAGSYAIDARALANPNYRVTANNGKLTVVDRYSSGVVRDFSEPSLTFASEKLDPSRDPYVPTPKPMFELTGTPLNVERDSLEAGSYLEAQLTQGILL